MSHLLDLNTLFNALKSHLSPQEIGIWFEDVSISEVDGETLTLMTPSLFRKEQIEKLYLASLLESAKEYLPELNQVKILHALSAKSNPTSSNTTHTNTDIPSTKHSPKQEESTKAVKPSVQDIEINPVNQQVLVENNFDRYVPTQENELAMKFVKKSITNLGEISPLYFYGKIGTGKTHLLQSVYNELKVNAPILKVKYVQPDDFVGEFTQALKLHRDREFRMRYRSLDVLLIDDIQFLAGKEKSGQEFFHIFNQIQTPGKQLIFCSDRPPSELGDLHDRLKSRLASSVILEIKPPSFESKLKIINFLVQEKNLGISDDVCHFLAEGLPDDIRQIVGAIKHLSLLNQIQQVPIDLSYCENNIQQLKTRRPNKGKYKPEDIIEVFCEKMQITLAEIKSPKKNQSISSYRQMISYLLKNHTNLSFKEIGALLGSRTPTSIFQNNSKVEEEIKHNLEKKKMLDLVLESI